MSSVNTGVSMKVSFIREGYANDAYKSMAYANRADPAHFLNLLQATF